MSPVRKVGKDLWGESPRRRLRAARALSPSESAAVQNDIISTSPMQPWPYGMPTVVNPFLVVLGPSPGNSPQRGDKEFIERRSYVKPTVGHCHPGFLYEDARGYWPRIRELSVGLVRGFDVKLSEQECYALSGQMNLGVGAFGNASQDAVEPIYARWVPGILIEKLRPRIVILVGLLSLLKGDANIRNYVASSGALDLDWRRPDQELPFEYYRRKRMVFRSWKVSRPDGQNTTIVSWPNHPSRSPMTIWDVWRASIREGADYFTK